MTIEEFDSLYTEVAKKHPKMEKKRLGRPDRKRAIGAGRRHVLSLKDRLVLCLFYIKTHATQEKQLTIVKFSSSTRQNITCVLIQMWFTHMRSFTPVRAKV